jgi:hypothetical protein
MKDTERDTPQEREQSDVKKSPTPEEEMVDETIDASFPASDPPSYTPVTGVKKLHEEG